MASKINYNNKAPFQTLEEIPDENKVNASDMNEIKEVVNTNAEELDTAKENIENLQGGQGTSNAEITSLKNRVSTLETDNETNKTNITNLKSNKVDKVEGKGLSTEDFTTELKTKLEGLENYNDTEVKADITELEGKVSTLETDNTTNKTNIESLQEDNTQNKADIEDLQESQEEQDSDIEALINALPSETQKDENVNIKGTIPVKFKEFKVSGNSKQETSDTMPSPEFPSPIQNVEGDVNVTVTNKNLFNSKKIQNSSIITVNDDNSITLSNNSNIIGYTDTKIKLKELAEGLKVGDLAYLKLITTYTGYSHIYIQGEYKGYWYNNTELVITQEILNSNVVLYGGYQKTDKLQIQITKNKLEDYVPYQQQTVTFPLSQGQKLMLGDYLAADGIHHVRKQIELDGTENWQQYNSRLYLYIEDAINVTSSDGTPNIKSNMFIATNFNNMSSNPDNAISYNLLGNEDQHKGICFYSNKYFTDVATLKSWLSTQKQAGTPVIVEYELAEEEVEAYTEEQQEAYNQLKQLTAYEEETNVYSTSEVSPVFSITAVKDVNSVITQLNTVLLERS